MKTVLKLLLIPLLWAYIGLTVYRRGAASIEEVLLTFTSLFVCDCLIIVGLYQTQLYQICFYGT